MPNALKSLDQLHDHWENCRACSLGVRRGSEGGAFVAGEGAKGGIMFIGEGPGEVEEQEGRPFVGPSGIVLRQIIKRFGLSEYYITNIVACRSCSPFLDAQGQPRFRKAYGKGPALPMVKDEPPLPVQIAACLPRVHEEIYLVDPVIIVTLGATASQAILGHPISITRDRGQTEHCSIPGASFRPVFTEKKNVWARKIKGQLELPTEVNEVRYEVMPTLHPAFVLRRHADRGRDSPLSHLIADIRTAVKIYERYMLETYGTLPALSTDVSDEDIQQDLDDED